MQTSEIESGTRGKGRSRCFQSTTGTIGWGYHDYDDDVCGKIRMTCGKIVDTVSGRDERLKCVSALSSKIGGREEGLPARVRACDCKSVG
jgi:hypothetical protein